MVVLALVAFLHSSPEEMCLKHLVYAKVIGAVTQHKRNNVASGMRLDHV